MTSQAAMVILILLSYLYNNGNNKHKCGICLQEITKIVMAILRRATSFCFSKDQARQMVYFPLTFQFLMGLFLLKVFTARRSYFDVR